jgi:hypothetical protein
MSQAYSFVRDGVESLGDCLDSRACQALYDRILADRSFSPEMFLPESVYRSNPQNRRVNPIQGERNLIERYDLSFIEQSPGFVAAMARVLGRGYRLERRKFVVSLPQDWVPDWVRKEVDGVASANINPYVREGFRDVTYMQGIDFHQDMIDFRDREPDFITCYIYLAPVGADDSPIYLVPGSHRLGGTVFPHDLRVLDGAGSRVLYRADDRHQAELPIDRLTGPAGTGYFWHSCMLHGTRLHVGRLPRISVRYIAQKDLSDSQTLLDRVNRELLRPGSLPVTRVDVDESGVVRDRRNAISSAIAVG